jgi:hypothetical protein
MKRALLAVVFLGSVLAASSATASMIGQCNALLGKFLGAEHQVVNGIDVAGNCNELGGRLNDFVNAGCVPLLDDGELFTGHIRADLPLIQSACTALCVDCRFQIPECGCP